MKPFGSPFIAFCLLIMLSNHSYAQTVSIITDPSDEGLMVEAAMKRHLRAEGYTVKGGTTEGYVVLLQVMKIILRSGVSSGVVGRVTIGHMEWQEVADMLVSEACTREHAFAQNVKDVLGTRIIYIGSTMAQGANAEGVAELLSTSVNTEIRQATRKLATFFEDMRQRSKAHEKEVISPYR